MPFAFPSGSLPTVGRGWGWPFSHNTGNTVGEGAKPGHEESERVVSATPVIRPRLFMAVACPLFPSSTGRALMWPFRQRNGRHVRCVPKPQKSSPFGSRTFVSEKPIVQSAQIGDLVPNLGDRIAEATQNNRRNARYPEIPQPF